MELKKQQYSPRVFFQGYIHIFLIFFFYILVHHVIFSTYRGPYFSSASVFQRCVFLGYACDVITAGSLGAELKCDNRSIISEREVILVGILSHTGMRTEHS